MKSPKAMANIRNERTIVRLYPIFFDCKACRITKNKERDESGGNDQI